MDQYYYIEPNMKRQTRLQEFQRDARQQPQITEEKTSNNKQSSIVHTMRAVVIILDVTKSMGMKDFKPSRLAAAVISIREFLRRLKQSTPVAVAALGLSSNGLCRMVTNLTYDVESIIEKLDEIRLQQNPGCFSLQSSLYQSIACLDKVKTTYHREILVIQSSPMTKDQQNLQETAEALKVAEVTLNEVSMCGWTEAIKRVVERLKGKYITVCLPEEMKRQVENLARPPDFSANSVRLQLVKMGLVRKQQTREEQRCFCHFKVIKTAYICSVCECTICQQPPLQCPMCETLLVMPTDLYNHTIST